MTTRHIQISGLVQGVVFRPYVYHLASENHLKGWVRNSTVGLEVLIQGENEDCENFLGSLPQQVPVGTDIQKILVKDLDPTELDGFSIISSKNGFDVNTDIAPDLGTCELCLEDIYKQPRRYHHLFTSCIHCGPRFSIIKKVPYDRDNTTMSDFAMCSGCKEEYEDIHNRRFHAQPIACLSCGPQYILYSGKKIISDQQQIISLLVNMLKKGKIIAIKGIGGYHLLCDPFNDDVVKRVRRIKKRDSKPLALLFKDLKTLREFTCIHPVEESIVSSSRRPIVIVDAKKSLSWYINQGLKSVGVMLPYMPLHYILMDELSLPALVCTSANYSGEPLISDNEKALKQLLPVCDAVLAHNRNIENSQDDSVVKIIGNQPALIRRSRGYVPEPVLLNGKADGILALGADMKTCFAIGKANKAILSQHIGDLDNYDTYIHYRKTIEDFLRLYTMQPDTLVSDLHPGYNSVRHLEKIADSLPTELKPRIMKVQHHHAHIASVMAEHQLDEEVIGVSMDGTGYGTDGKIWGSEFMVCSLSGFNRMYHIGYLKLPGGELAIKEPWRIALACLFDIYGEKCLDKHRLSIERTLQIAVLKSIESRLNISESCGMGRLFDAVASLLNVCHYSGYDGEGPVILEELINKESPHSYNYSLKNNEFRINEIISGIVEDVSRKTEPSEISSRFHNTIVSMIVDGISRISRQTKLKKVVLSGGTFQNRYLTEHTAGILEKKGFSVYLNRKVPANDGGLALGQIAIAMKRRALNI